MGWIRANILDWSKRIRLNRADRIRARRAERRICDGENVWKVDKI